MRLGYLVAGLLDIMTTIPLTIVVLLTMLQDRKRPLWPVFVMVAPLVAGLAWCVASGSEELLPVLIVYFLLMWLGVIIYMVRSLVAGIRIYGKRLYERNNKFYFEDNGLRNTLAGGSREGDIEKVLTLCVRSPKERGCMIS